MTTAAPDRAATVAALRERLLRLGGLPGGAVPPPPEGRATPSAGPGPPQLSGFRVACDGVLLRQVRVDLGPFLSMAGAPRPARADELLGLAWGRSPADGEGRWSDDEVAVLDVESLGLRGSGVVAFLVGIGAPDGDGVLLDQFLLADPGREASLLQAVMSRLARPRLMVTYNGCTFDLPVLRSRCVVNRLSPAPLEGRLHCDLLAAVRRLFRDRLGSCTLRQAERGLLGMERQGDVPGAEAPARYRAWLRGAGAEVLDGVVAHNQLDLCATLVLGARLTAHVDGRLVEPVHPADRYRLAAHLERGGVADGVDDHYRASLESGQAPWDRHAGHRLARLLQGRGPDGHAQAASIWRDLWRRDRHDLCAARALAIALGRDGRLAEALGVAELALEVCAAMPEWRLGRLRGAPPAGWEAEWLRRRDRLRVRLRGGRSREGRQRPAGAAALGPLVTPPLLAK